MEGNVGSQFLYGTLLSTDLLPFGHLGYGLVVLPIKPSKNGYEIITAAKAKDEGFLHLAQWLEKAQAEWERRRGSKAKSMSIYERLDRIHGLTTQNPQAKYRAIYPMSATYLCACVVENEPIEFNINGQKVRVGGFVADYVTYHLIPRFDASNQQHLRLAELGKACSQKVAQWLNSGGARNIRSIGVLRKRARQLLASELEEIDEKVKEIMPI